MSEAISLSLRMFRHISDDDEHKENYILHALFIRVQHYSACLTACLTHPSAVSTKYRTNTTRLTFTLWRFCRRTKRRRMTSDEHILLYLNAYSRESDDMMMMRRQHATRALNHHHQAKPQTYTKKYTQTQYGVLCFIYMFQYISLLS